MKWTAVLLLVFSLYYVYGLSSKKLLLIGPDGAALIAKHCTAPAPVPKEDVIPLQEYQCAINGEQVIIITAPVFQGIKELGTSLHSIGSFEHINLVVLMWPIYSEYSFEAYTPIALSFLPYIHNDQRPFVVMVPPLSEEKEEGFQDLQHRMGIQKVVQTGPLQRLSLTRLHKRIPEQYSEVFGNLVSSINSSVHVSFQYKPGKDASGSGCLASLNVVETRTGEKLVKDVEIGDELLTPRGYMPVIYVEDHPNTTFPCVHYAGVWLTEDHFVMVEAGSMANMTMRVQLEVRTIVVKGDSFFCHHVLVSSYSRFRWLPSFSFIIDYLPASVIAQTRRVLSLVL